MSKHHVDGKNPESLSAARLVGLGAITLIIAFTIINFIAETGINRP